MVTIRKVSLLLICPGSAFLPMILSKPASRAVAAADKMKGLAGSLYINATGRQVMKNPASSRTIVLKILEIFGGLISFTGARLFDGTKLRRNAKT